MDHLNTGSLEFEAILFTARADQIIHPANRHSFFPRLKSCSDEAAGKSAYAGNQ